MLPPDLLRSALESAPDAILISNPQGSIVFASRQVEVLFGYHREEILGQAIEYLLPERFRTDHSKHRAEFGRRPRLRPMGVGIALFARRKDGSEFPVEISLSPVENAGVTLIVAAVRDVTERKRIDAGLREIAEQASRAKSRFLSTASHDLRQPLQALSLLNGALSRMTLPPDAMEALTQQAASIGTMSRLVHALLDISRIESGTIRPESVDFAVTPVLEVLQREFASVAASKGLHVQVESRAAIVRSDPSLTEQILRNLISNAIKYTHQGKVTLRCTQTANEVGIEVHDTGIGMAAEQIPHIYEEFFRISRDSKVAGDGYGLGLTIVNSLVRLLELRLEVRSELGKGSVFTLRLPAGIP
jgi:two-component system, sensor histidine kinase